MRINSSLKLISLTTIALVATLAGTQPAYAKAGHVQAGPAVFDYSDSGALYAKKEREVAMPSESSCYIEPTGFHYNIRWDGACMEAMKRRAAARSASANTQPQKFVEPRGFHNQIRWTD